METKLIQLLKKLSREINFLILKPKSILYDHLPKCAGTTVSNYLTSAFPSRYVFALSGVNPEESVEEFKNLPQRKRDKIKLVSGHLAHKLLEYVHEDTIPIVVFRDPIERIISHYYYVKRTKIHYLHEKLEKENIQLKDYCSSNLSSELQNYYVTHFTGLSISDVENNPKKAVELAFNIIISKYHLIGFQDSIPAFLKELAQLANLNKTYKNKVLNKTNDRIKLEELQQSVIDNLSQENYLDIELYKKLIASRQNGVIHKKYNI